MHECTQPRSHIVACSIHTIYYWQVQVGVKSGSALEKYVTHSINTTRMFKAFLSAERRGATSGLWLLSHCLAQVGDGFGFQPEVCLWRESNCRSEDERTERDREAGGGRPGWRRLPRALWVVVLVYCLSALIFIKLWGQMQSDAMALLWKGGVPSTLGRESSALPLQPLET